MDRAFSLPKLSLRPKLLIAIIISFLFGNHLFTLLKAYLWLTGGHLLCLSCGS